METKKYKIQQKEFDDVTVHFIIYNGDIVIIHPKFCNGNAKEVAIGLGPTYKTILLCEF